jgi:undecaprenyl diphosphate synthase
MTADLLRQVLTGGVPDPDLLIRTAGEQRLSDFLLWELAYAELVFTRTLWPEFRRTHLATAIDEFRRRDRKFGGLIPRPHPAAEPRPDGLAVGR